ncbi:MAG: DNA helicase UvrD [Acidobacteria bacterium]|nr:MAG: DNA helicase UvrD [Acidobacteriota bacterium]
MSIPNLIVWGKRKGIHLLGTGDFTDPDWLGEIEDHLEQDDCGFLKPREETEIRFLLTTELETLFQVRGEMHRIHLLITAPHLEAVKSLRQNLQEVTDLSSGGLPRSGVSAAELVERVLEASPQSLAIPAHIWIPVTGLYGSHFGFDSLQDCFEGMAAEIHAVETGLSSDPGMCWRVRELDSRQIVSFSDAHSLSSLGREFTIFEGEFSYAGVCQALKSSGEARIAGTVEYCSELGKYYFNGHRECKVTKSPIETRFEGKGCPVCRKEITVGTFHRCLEMADRAAEDLDVVQEGGWIQSRTLQKPPYRRMIPLREIIAASYGITGKESQTVEKIYEEALACGSSEREILLEMSEPDLRCFVDHRVSEGIIRVRETRYRISPGYDGVYGGRESVELMQMKLFEHH